MVASAHGINAVPCLNLTCFNMFVRRVDADTAHGCCYRGLIISLATPTVMIALLPVLLQQTPDQA